MAIDIFSIYKSPVRYSYRALTNPFKQLLFTKFQRRSLCTCCNPKGVKTIY